MTSEAPLQRDMFTGELVDTRTARQKQAEAKRAHLQQATLFSSREVAQFGVTARPLLPLAPKTQVALILQDFRTVEEREQDAKRAAEAKTHHLFGETTVPGEEISAEEPEPLNQFALICLRILHRDSTVKHKNVDFYFHRLWTIRYMLHENEIIERANRIWALNGEVTLRTTFEQLVEESGFSFPLLGFQPGQEAWWAAWQLAIEDIEANPPPLPTFSRETIKAWFEEDTQDSSA